MFTLISIIQIFSKPIQLYLDSIQKSSHSMQNNLVFKIQTKRTKVISRRREAVPDMPEEWRGNCPTQWSNISMKTRMTKQKG